MRGQTGLALLFQLYAREMRGQFGVGTIRGQTGHSQFPIHPLHSAIEFILKPLAQKSLRRPHPSASLFMDTVSPHPALASSLQRGLALLRNRIV